MLRLVDEHTPDKVFQSEETFPVTGEPVVQVVTPGMGMEKFASEASEYIQNVSSEPGYTYALVLAMGAGEYYGANRNGDFFTEEELRQSFKTFETHAKIYKHHANKDPKKAYGDVVKAFYNERMHRVELLLKIDNAKCPDIVEKLLNGEFPAVSMGCRIKFDVCSICGNKAPTRNEYCYHARHEMNRIYPDGRKVFVYNPGCIFFDISFVFRPADRIGWTLKKVAEFSDVMGSFEMAEKVAWETHKQAALRKVSELHKFVTGQITEVKAPDFSPKEQAAIKYIVGNVSPAVSEHACELPEEVIDELGEFPLGDSLDVAGRLGIQLTTPEFLQLFMRQVTGSLIPRELFYGFSDMMGLVYAELCNNPEIVDEVLESGILDPSGDSDSCAHAHRKLAEFRSQRDFSTANLQKLALFGGSYKDRGEFMSRKPPNTDLFTHTDPNTGERFQTTRADVNATRTAGGLGVRDTLTHPQSEAALAAGRLLVGGLLLGGIHTALKGSRFKHVRWPATLLGGAAGASKIVGDYDPGMMSDQGEILPSNTPFTKRSSVLNSAAKQFENVTIGGLAAGMGYDHFLRDRRGLGASAAQKYIQALDEHPAAAAIATLGTLFAANRGGSKLRSLTKSAEDATDAPAYQRPDPVKDFDALAHKIHDDVLLRELFGDDGAQDIRSGLADKKTLRSADAQLKEFREAFQNTKPPRYIENRLGLVDRARHAWRSRFGDDSSTS